ILAVGTDRQFAQLCEVLGLNEVPTDHRFATNPERVRNRMALAALLAPAIGSAHRDDLLDQLLRPEFLPAPCGTWPK
ncbi:MAG TPA: CoA transferase, partial [Flavobacteriales bacterium]|nr:CoA transferase [Flavobacteriales bacterium]